MGWGFFRGGTKKMVRKSIALAYGGLLVLGLGLTAIPLTGQVPPPPPPPPELSGGRLRLDVNLVLVNVTVTDPFNRFVTGLGKEHFTVAEDKIGQNIQYFSNEDMPISLGIVFDVSGSMGNSGKFPRASQAAVEFLKTANPQDEFFVVTFSDNPEILTGFTNSVEEVQNRLLFARPDGRTSLYDALYLAMDKMAKANNPRKALLILSDGGDNRSRYSVRDIKAAVRESDVQIYSIGIFDPVTSRESPEQIYGPILLRDLSEMTGGRMFPIELHNVSELPDVTAKISLELRNQYVLGYRPTNVRRDGSWRKIKVEINAPRGLPHLNVYNRTGYYAPSQ
jgi:Ca-activated chloride channel family protein